MLVDVALPRLLATARSIRVLTGELPMLGCCIPVDVHDGTFSRGSCSERGKKKKKTSVRILKLASCSRRREINLRLTFRVQCAIKYARPTVKTHYSVSEE